MIFAVLPGAFFPEFAIRLSISVQVNNGLFASAVPHPSVGKAIFFVFISEGADEFGVFRFKASSRLRSRFLCLV